MGGENEGDKNLTVADKGPETQSNSWFSNFLDWATGKPEPPDRIPEKDLVVPPIWSDVRPHTMTHVDKIPEGLKDSVVTIGVESQTEGVLPGKLTGFFVNPNMAAGPTSGNDRVIVTSSHGFADAWVKNTLADSFLRDADTNKDRQISRKELEDIVRSTPENEDGKLYRFQHLLKNFDQILNLSKNSTPDAEGITPAGISAFISQDRKVTIKTNQGEFEATLVYQNPDTDVAVLELNGISPEQLSQLGKNLILKRGPVPRGTTAVAVESDSDGLNISIGGVLGSQQSGVARDPRSNSTAPVIYSDSKTRGGFSGGPLVTFDSNSEPFVIGLHHGRDYKHRSVAISSEAVLEALKQYNLIKAQGR
ncbi:MAG: trypsin-like peptidase domain-containing protein [Cyanobacteria bacterium TGS_CYA1]|nr:trypsin-like peptidase domain-containing protein [Cyanobacteria bacterium TGS_CYA1]